MIKQNNQDNVKFVMQDEQEQNLERAPKTMPETATSVPGGHAVLKPLAPSSYFSE